MYLRVDEKWREPDASRTLLYLPLESDTTDYSGNDRTTTASWITFTTAGGVASANAGQTSWITVWPDGFISTSLTKCVCSFLYYSSDSTQSRRRNMFEFKTPVCTFSCILQENTTNFLWGYVWSGITIPFTANAWNHICITWDANGISAYKNGVLVTSITWSSAPRWPWDWSQYLQKAMCGRDWPNGNWNGGYWAGGNMRELIFENDVRTAEDVANYYTRITNELGIA